MNKELKEIQEILNTLTSDNVKVEVFSGTKEELAKLICNEFDGEDKVKENYIKYAKQDFLTENMPFEAALIALKAGYNVKRKNWKQTILVAVNGRIYIQDAESDNIYLYDVAAKDLNATDWMIA